VQRLRLPADDERLRDVRTARRGDRTSDRQCRQLLVEVVMQKEDLPPLLRKVTACLNQRNGG